MKNKGHESQRLEPFRRMNDQRRGIGSSWSDDKQPRDGEEDTGQCPPGHN
jgi:hypothetical protein